jgi:hypothetical protein
MTADDICKALLAGKTPEATRKQESNRQAAILAALRARKGGAVSAEGFPQRWQLNRPPTEAASSRSLVGSILRQ